MYAVDTEGGEPRFLLASAGWGLFYPTFSPDGAQIAYFDGGGDVDNTLRVMNADGSGVRVVIDQEFGHVDDLAWSPDGSRLAFQARTVVPSGSSMSGSSASTAWTHGRVARGVRPKVVADGSAACVRVCRRDLGHQGRWLWTPAGSPPRQTRPHLVPGWLRYGVRRRGFAVRRGSGWDTRSDPGHSRANPIAQTPPGGSGVRVASHDSRLVWIPQPLSASGEEQPTATVGGSGAAPFVYAITVLGAVGVIVIAWRARRRIAAR